VLAPLGEADARIDDDPLARDARPLREVHARAQLGADLGGRVSLSWERATSSPWTALVVAASVLALALLAARLPRLELPRDGRALLVAFLAAIAVSLVVNDSPGDVAAGGLVGYLALERFARRPEPVPRGLQFRHPLSRSTT